LIEVTHPELSLSKQCELVGLNRSSYYYESTSESAENLFLMRRIDELYMESVYYGSRRILAMLRREGHRINRKRVMRLMNLMGLEAVYPKKRLSVPNVGHKKYPYLLRGLGITKPNQVWSTDITYIPMKNGFLYLVAILDWYSRYVLTWELSNSLDVHFCKMALEKALAKAKPEIFNSDQGCQFTSPKFCSGLESAGIRISMDGRGRALDNVFIERLWRSLKHEEVYLNVYENTLEASHGIEMYLLKYNTRRPHQSLGYLTPEEVHFSKRELTKKSICG